MARSLTRMFARNSPQPARQLGADGARALAEALPRMVSERGGECRARARAEGSAAPVGSERQKVREGERGLTEGIEAILRG